MTVASSMKEVKDPGEARESIEFIASNKPVDRAGADCAWVALFATPNGVELTMPARVVDKVSNGALARLLKAGDFDAKAGTTLLLRDLDGLASTRVLLVGLGKKEALTEKVFADAVKSATKAMVSLKGVKRVSSYLTEVAVGSRDGSWRVQTHVLACREALYRFDRFKSKASPEGAAKPLAKTAKATKVADAPSLRSVEMLLPGDLRPTDAPKIIAEAQALANGIELTKDLGNLPPNICTPTFLANTAKTLARQFRLKAEVLDRAAMEKLGMNALLAVAQGSVQPPQFIVLQHNGGTAKDAPLVLVGKGITFDTGGISLKPPAEMDEMKYDMSGASSVLGVMHAVAEMGLKRNVVGVIPTAENMPSGSATRPGDIVQTMSGQTVEILNTDAEGRLILCDALTYVDKQFKPAAVVDIATLTGACVIALGAVNSGLFSADEALAQALIEAGKTRLDTAWRMPLEEDYQEQLKSPFADMANIGGRAAGSVTAACFLWRFAKNYRWAHLDIAGTAWRSGQNKGATGRPVGLLVEFLKNGLA
jgi:leucyl aminopeptidase